VRGRPRNVLPASIPRPLPEPRLEPAREDGGDVALEALVREWLLELKVMGRSPRTIDWYAQKMRSYLAASNTTRLSELTACELKRFLGELRDRGLAPNTIHGFFETLKALASWAQREHYAVDAALLRMRPPGLETMARMRRSVIVTLDVPTADQVCVARPCFSLARRSRLSRVLDSGRRGAA
jgi:hypothetical protein